MSMMRAGELLVEIPSSRPRKSKRVSQWDVIKAARAFYGRPLGPDELRKIRVAQEVASQSRPRLRAVPSLPRLAMPDHAQRVHRAGEGDVQQASVEGAA